MLLNVQLENRVFLFPQGGYTIDDIKELPSEPKRIDIARVDNKILQDFLLTNPPRPFVEEPWNELQIEQKIAFEDELKNELGIIEKSFLYIFRKPEKHILFDSEFSSFCHDQRNDDILFEIKKPKFDKQFALVHLTWTSKKKKKVILTRFFIQTLMTLNIQECMLIKLNGKIKITTETRSSAHNTSVVRFIKNSTD